MIEPKLNRRGGKHRLAVLTWLGVYPVLTAIAMLLDPILVVLSVALQTLVMSAIMVPIMVYIVMPGLTYFSSRFECSASS